MSTGSDVWDDLSRMGGYFALPTVGPGAVRYRQLATLEVATQFVDATRAAIAASARVPVEAIEHRVAASSFHLAVAARLMSPIIAAALRHHVIPLLTADNVHFSTQNHTPVFCVADVDLHAVHDLDAAAREISALLPDLFEPLNRTLHRMATLSPQISTGNVVSAANGAVTVLAMTHPHIEPAGRALVGALLAGSPLADAGRMEREIFTRRSCCLFYKVPGAGLCGDCVITR